LVVSSIADLIIRRELPTAHRARPLLSERSAMTPRLPRHIRNSLPADLRYQFTCASLLNEGQHGMLECWRTAQEMKTCKPHILVVDDEPDLLAFLEDLLCRSGFDAEGMHNGAQMHEALAGGSCSLVLLDLHLNGEDGFTLARELRQCSDIPIIMMSGASDETDRVLLLETVADDFLVKPFCPRELLARVRAVLRRRGVGEEAPPSRAPLAYRALSCDHLCFGNWVLDVARRELVNCDGAPCALTPTEFRVLEAFVRQPRRVWTREQLLEQASSLESQLFDRSIDTLILRLRRKIEPNPKHPQYICTERGMGYMFAAQVTRS